MGKKKWRSTVRWTPANYDWLVKESERTGTPIAQLANQIIADKRQQADSKVTAAVATQ